MEYRHLGRTGLLVSPLALGTMNFGNASEESECRSILDEATDAGINFIDTADVYGPPQSPDIRQGNGLSEEIIGRWLDDSGKRNELVLATKLYQPMGLGPNDRRLSACHIRAACEASLRRLKTDRIDLLQMHHIDRFTPIDEILEAFSRLIADGKVIYAGSCNFPGWYIAAMECKALNRHMLGLASEQSLYNLAERTVELEVLPACRHFGLGFLPWSPLGGGLLAGVLGKTLSGRRATPAAAQMIEKHRSQLEAYEQHCAEIGVQPADAALAWLLSNPLVTAPLIGPRTTDQLRMNLRALDVKLSAETMKRLDEIWPGPGGEAPEAYAW